MSSHREKYQHLVGKNADEVVEALKADGLEPRIYHHMGLIRSENPKMVQVQVDPQSKTVQKIS